MSSSRPAPVGCQPSDCCVIVLETGLSSDTHGVKPADIGRGVGGVKVADREACLAGEGDQGRYAVVVGAVDREGKPDGGGPAAGSL